MRLAALIAGKDLRETARDKLSFIFILLMPLAFTLFFGLLFGGGSDVDKLPLAVWDADGGTAAKELVADLDASVVVRVVAKQGGEPRAVDGRRARRRRPHHPRGLQRRGRLRRREADLTIVATQGTEPGASSVASGDPYARRRAGDRRARPPKPRRRPSGQTRSMPAGAQAGVVAESAAEARPVVAQALAHPAVYKDPGRRGRGRRRAGCPAASSSARRA